MGFLKLMGFLFALPSADLCAMPSWVETFGQSSDYPEASYLTGYGSSECGGDTDKCIQTAKKTARANLIEKIQVKIETATTYSIRESGGVVSENFARVIQSTSNLKIYGLDVKIEHDPKARRAHALAVVSRLKLADACRQRALILENEISAQFEAGRRHAQVGNSRETIRAYGACFPLVRELDGIEAIRIGLGIAGLRALEQEEPSGIGGRVMASTVREAMAPFLGRDVASVQDAALQLVHVLNGQLSGIVREVAIMPFTYRDTDVPGEFSRFLGQAIESRAAEDADWPTAVGVHGLEANAGISPLQLSGQYWDQGDSIWVVASVSDPASIHDGGGLVAGAEVWLPKTIVGQAGIRLEPEDLARKMKTLALERTARIEEQRRRAEAAALQKQSERLRKQSVWRSAVFPGWGQWSVGRHGSGGLFMLATAGFGAAALQMQAKASDAVDRAVLARTAGERDRLVAEHKDWKSRRNLMLVGIGANWLASVFHASRISVRANLDTRSDDGVRITIGYTHPIEAAPRGN